MSHQILSKLMGLVLCSLALLFFQNCANSGFNASSMSLNSQNGSSAVNTVSVLHVSGNLLLDGSGNTVHLRGVNYSGYEFTAIDGFDLQDPSGAQAGQGEGPNLTAIKAWNANALRIPLNEASWLGYSCTDTSGVVHNPDPGGNYKSAVMTQVQAATSAGIYVILDLHFSAPGTACPMLQTQMADMDHSIDFWASVASTFKNNGSVIFELYNEPYFYGLAPGEDEWSVWQNGGTLTWYPATSNSGNWQQVNTSWKVAGMQQMINAVRGAGATNMILLSGTAYNNDMSGWLTHQPTDPLNQIAASWHPYPPTQSVAAVTIASGGAGYAVNDTITLAQPNTVYIPLVLTVTSVSKGVVNGVSIASPGSYLETHLPTGAQAQASTSGVGQGATFNLTYVNQYSNWSMPSNWPTVASIAAQVPVILTEVGEHNASGTVGSPFLQQLLPWADQQGISYLGWGWDVWQNTDNVLIENVTGNPTDGFGKYFHDHLLCAGTSGCK